MHWTPACVAHMNFFSLLSFTEERLPPQGSQGHSNEVSMSGGRAAMFHLELKTLFLFITQKSSNGDT